MRPFKRENRVVSLLSTLILFTFTPLATSIQELLFSLSLSSTRQTTFLGAPTGQSFKGWPYLKLRDSTLLFVLVFHETDDLSRGPDWPFIQRVTLFKVERFNSGAPELSLVHLLIQSSGERKDRRRREKKKKSQCQLSTTSTPSSDSSFLALCFFLFFLFFSILLSIDTRVTGNVH